MKQLKIKFHFDLNLILERQDRTHARRASKPDATPICNSGSICLPTVNKSFRIDGPPAVEVGEIIWKTTTKAQNNDLTICVCLNVCLDAYAVHCLSFPPCFFFYGLFLFLLTYVCVSFDSRLIMDPYGLYTGSGARYAQNAQLFATNGEIPLGEQCMFGTDGMDGAPSGCSTHH